MGGNMARQIRIGDVQMEMPFMKPKKDRMKIAVMIPIVYPYYLPSLIEDINRNSVMPDAVWIIYNGDKEIGGILNSVFTQVSLVKMYNGLVTINSTPMGVNECWNAAVKRFTKEGYDLFSILNDDIRIERWFFEKIGDLFKKDKLNGGKLGVVSPQTVMRSQFNNNMFMSPYPPGHEFLSTIPAREGWAYTISRECAADVFPIPEELQTFCGDDWIWERCKRTGWQWKGAVNVFVEHLVGGTCRNNTMRANLKSEKRHFESLLRRMN